MHRKKTLTKIKSHQELSLKICNQRVLFPNLATMQQSFIQVNRTSDRSTKSMKRMKRPTLISLSIRVICKDEVNSMSLKNKTKYGFLFLISFVLFQSLQLLKRLLKFAQKYLIIFQRRLELCNIYITFYFLSLSILDKLSDLIFAVFDLSTRGSLINGRTCISFHFSCAIELIILPFL